MDKQIAKLEQQKAQADKDAADKVWLCVVRRLLCSRVFAKHGACFEHARRPQGPCVLLSFELE